MKRLAIAALAAAALCGCDTRHEARVYKLRNHHISMIDDKGRWFECVVKNADIDFDVPFPANGGVVIPPGGSWRAATQEEIDETLGEVANGTQGTETTVDETDAGTPDGAGDVGGDSGSDGGDGGDGGGDE